MFDVVPRMPRMRVGLALPAACGPKPSSSGGTMVVAQGCTAISSADPQIAGYRKIAGS
jgi:hypothetical protein